jgi:hypothetical protein
MVLYRRITEDYMRAQETVEQLKKQVRAVDPARERFREISDEAQLISVASLLQFERREISIRSSHSLLLLFGCSWKR